MTKIEDKFYSWDYINKIYKFNIDHKDNKKPGYEKEFFNE